MTKLSVLAVANFLVIATCAAQLIAQESSERGADSQKVMQKWIEFMTPGAEHELLKYKVGKWTMKVELRTGPDQPATTSEGTSEMKLIMGGRYLMDNTKSNFQGNPFEGLGLTGYDNLKKRFVSVWIDNLGTGFTISSGTYDESTKTYKYTTMSPDVVSGQYKRTRTTEHVVNDDQWVAEMYDTAPDGKEFLMMKATYTRVK